MLFKSRSTLNSGKLAFGWNQTMGRCGKDRMSEKKNGVESGDEGFKVFGAEMSILTKLWTRLRDYFEKENIRDCWLFLKWLIGDPQVGVIREMLLVGLNRWQADREKKAEWLCPKCRRSADELRSLGKTRSLQGYEQCVDCHADICSRGEAGPEFVFRPPDSGEGKR